jgi:hypothetical protein
MCGPYFIAFASPTQAALNTALLVEDCFPAAVFVVGSFPTLTLLLAQCLGLCVGISAWLSSLQFRLWLLVHATRIRAVL